MRTSPPFLDKKKINIIYWIDILFFYSSNNNANPNYSNPQPNEIAYGSVFSSHSYSSSSYDYSSYSSSSDSSTLSTKSDSSASSASSNSALGTALANLNSFYDQSPGSHNKHAVGDGKITCYVLDFARVFPPESPIVSKYAKRGGEGGRRKANPAFLGPGITIFASNFTLKFALVSRYSYERGWGFALTILSGDLCRRSFTN